MNSNDLNNVELYPILEELRDRFDPDAMILTDREVLSEGICEKTLFIYGTPMGNLWLRKYFAELPFSVKPGVITAGTALFWPLEVTSLPIHHLRRYYWIHFLKRLRSVQSANSKILWISREVHTSGVAVSGRMSSRIHTAEHAGRFYM